ncbi:Ankyrin repeat domain containing protein, partial [Asbolus verrucosus]
MMELHHQSAGNWWPLRVDLKAHNSFLKEKRDSEAVLTHFMELHQNQDPFLRKLKTLFLQKKKVIILLDGLDEIENVCVENILECTEQWSSVGYRVWLSSRQNLQQKLEDFFNIFVTQIDELSEEQQKFYVQNRLRQQYEEEEIEAIVAKIFDSIANNRHVLGVPLQLHIITQIFLDDRSYFRNVSVNWFVLTKMYKIFFEGRYKYSVEKMQPKNPFLSVGALEDQLEKYEIAALQSLFDDDVFASLNLDVRGNRRFLGQIRRQKDPLGIIVNINGENKAVFEHFTFGEYFAAVFLIHNFDKARLLKRHIFSERYQDLLLIFNLMMAEEDATQLAVVFKDSNRIRKCTHDEASRLSKGGRNLLQLAASCSTRYPLIRHDGEAISQKEIKGFKGETATMRKIVGFLSSSKIDPLAKDEVFEWDSFDYALASGSLYTIEAILENHERGGFHETLQKHYDDLSLAYYSLRFGYPNILSAIIARTGFALPKICCHSFLESTPILSLGVMSECARKIEILTVLLGSEKPTWWKKWTKKSPKRLKINTASRYGFTLLHFASAEGDAIVVDFLLKRGADVNVRNDFGHSPLHLAVKNANFDVATLLVDSGADIDARDGDSETPLHYAARSGHVDIIDLLVSEGAKIGDVLPCAVGGGHFDAVDLLVKKGANLSQVLLHEAASEGEVRIVELLLRQGLSVDARNGKGETALHRAVVGGRVEALRFLIQRGSDVGAVANNGDTLLHYAVRYWNHDRSLVDLLLSQPQTVGLLRVANEEGATPLHLAVYEGKVEVVGLILEKTTPDVDVDHEHYPLNFATENGRPRKEALLEMARVIKKIK